MEEKIKTTEESKELEWGYENPQLVAQTIKDNFPLVGGFDEDQVLKGHVFERILNDDLGEFGTAALCFEPKIMKPGGATEHKTTFLNRLRWEEEQPQTPQVIKDAIAALRQKLEGEWDKEENVKAARAFWEKMVHSKAKAMVDANEDGAGDAVGEYYQYMEEASKRRLST